MWTFDLFQLLIFPFPRAGSAEVWVLHREKHMNSRNSTDLNVWSRGGRRPCASAALDKSADASGEAARPPHHARLQAPRSVRILQTCTHPSLMRGPCGSSACQLYCCSSAPQVTQSGPPHGGAEPHFHPFFLAPSPVRFRVLTDASRRSAEATRLLWSSAGFWLWFVIWTKTQSSSRIPPPVVRRVSEAAGRTESPCCGGGTQDRTLGSLIWMLHHDVDPGEWHDPLSLVPVGSERLIRDTFI